MDRDTVTLERCDTPLTQLYREHRLALVRLGVLLLGDQAAAEDAVQDVFTAVHRRGIAVTHAYLRAAVVNRCRSAIRHTIIGRRKVVPLQPPEPEPGERLELIEEHQQVLAALDRLPRRQREVLVLRYYSQLSVAEVATALGIHEGTVKSSAARGLARLRELLGEA